MKLCNFYIFILPACLYSQIACRELSASEPAGEPPAGIHSTGHIDADEKADTAKLEPVHDPAWDPIQKFRVETRQDYNNRHFDALELQAAELRASKAVFKSGSWKIVQFYSSLQCKSDAPESVWQLHDQICRDWIAAKQDSITARVAYADFLRTYAWHARGHGFASEVTSEGWRVFAERSNAAHKVLDEASTLPDKDPYWYMVALDVALGEKLNPVQYESLITEAQAAEPKFWGYETSRAFSLLPRWHGEPGDWEAYAAKAATRPNGLGVEIYARIVTSLLGYYDNIFRETRASWPTTRDGLAVLRKKYPDSLEILSNSALLATLAQDHVVAKEMFDTLGNRYLPSAWPGPESFVRCRRWAQAGQ